MDFKKEAEKSKEQDPSRITFKEVLESYEDTKESIRLEKYINTLQKRKNSDEIQRILSLSALI